MISLLLVVAVAVLDVYGVVVIVVGAGVAVQDAVVLGVAGINIVDKCAPLLMINGAMHEFEHICFRKQRYN